MFTWEHIFLITIIHKVVKDGEDLKKDKQKEETCKSQDDVILFSQREGIPWLCDFILLRKKKRALKKARLRLLLHNRDP